MNKNNASAYLPLVQALADGAVIQANRGTIDDPQWVDLEAPQFTCEPELYRVKPA